ncbi:MAG TPA: hypothetical protein VGJ20_20630 [Xanthobacteraceae bacterium]|jgi:hypothetical protein
MKPLRSLSLRAEVVVDQYGFLLTDADRNVIGVQPIPALAKLTYALATNTQSGLTRRYVPSHPEGETKTFGIDFSAAIALGLGIASGTLTIFTNVVPPVDVTAQWIIDPVQIIGRALYATVSGGVDGTDYRFVWEATDTNGLTYVRTVLCLCAATA